MISNTLFGLQSAEASAHDLFTLNKAKRWQRLVKLQLPAAIPSIFTGLRNAAGLSVIGAIVGDFFFQQGSQGIGGLLRTYTLRLNMESLFLAIIRSEEHTSELQSLMRSSYAVFCLKKKNTQQHTANQNKN